MVAAPAMAWGPVPLWVLRRGWTRVVRHWRRITLHKDKEGGLSLLVCLESGKVRSSKCLLDPCGISTMSNSLFLVLCPA